MKQFDNELKMHHVFCIKTFYKIHDTKNNY